MSGGKELAVAHYFGSQEQLFGVHHPAPADTRTGPAVLLCAPLGQEQIRSHRLYRQLATALAARGMPCLRFDYFGSGDSAGASAERDWHRCQSDVVEATAQLRRLAGRRPVVAFGTRLGASLVLESAVEAGFEAAVLWDAVLDGASLVERMDRLQQQILADTERFLSPRSAAMPPAEWSGFTVSPSLREQLRGMHPEPPAWPCLWLQSADQPALSTSLPARHSVETLPQPTAWEALDRLEIAILSHEVIRHCCDWIGERR